ncbi:uncharacterized protein LOC143910705 [Arctopsyche grandis]|uniref:uncharacterized protein LOC143910705 n=1 Tax=Arctopsyche grandis TaxID=121162 RepID=UPI00406D929F
MFSKLKSTSKNDLRGVFRSMFSNNNSRLDDISNQTSFNKDKKNTFTRKLKTRLSSMRLSSRSQWKKEGFTSYITTGGEYHTISTPDTDKDDLNVTSLSSILKTSKASKSSMKKKLRFMDDNSVSKECINSDQSRQKSATVEVTDKEQIPNESDIAYYKKLKKELLDRNKDIVTKSPLNRKASSASMPSYNTLITENLEKVKKIDENLFYYPPISEFLQEESSKTTLEQLTIAHGICTYVSTCPSPLNNTDPTALNEISPPEFNLKAWPREDDNVYVDEISSSSSYSVPSSSQTMECANTDTVYSYKECENNHFSGKISSFKKNKRRFNPISKSCTVSLLSRKDETSRMSWCSA